MRYIHDEQIDGIMSKFTLLDVHTFYVDRWEFLSQTILLWFNTMALLLPIWSKIEISHIHKEGSF